MQKMTRRQFILGTVGSLAALEAGKRLAWIKGGLKTVHAAEFPQAAVAQGTKENTPEEILYTALAAVGGLSRFIHTGNSVAIKINATWNFLPHTASSTDPDVLRALIHLVREAGAGRIVVIDHCSLQPGAEECLRVSGLGKVISDEKVESVIVDRQFGDDSLFTRISVPEGSYFDQFEIIQAATQADVRINLAVAKTHSVTQLTMCMKGMMGFLRTPGGLHENLFKGIPDLNTPTPIRADLHILEAIRVRYPVNGVSYCAGPETDETHPQAVQRKNEIVAGTDPALIDSYGAWAYYQISPRQIGYLYNAELSQVGQIDIKNALQDGRVQFFPVGRLLPTSTPEPTAVPETQTPTAERISATPSGISGQSTPVLPPMTPAPAATAEPVADARPFLRGALIPAAVAVAGAGLALGRRKKAHAEESDDEHP